MLTCRLCVWIRPRSRGRPCVNCPLLILCGLAPSTVDPLDQLYRSREGRQAAALARMATELETVGKR